MNKYEEAKYVEAMLAKYFEETGQEPTPEAVAAWIDSKDEQEKLALGDAMMKHKESEENLERVLRYVDQGVDNKFFAEAAQQWARDKSEAQKATLKETMEAMVRFLDPSYEGKISAAACKVKANGEEITRRTRDALMMMLNALQ